MSRLAALIATFTTLSACASTQTVDAIPRAAISWPLASSPGRVVWVKSISDPADINRSKGFWQRISDAVSGEEPSAIVRPYGILRAADGTLYLADPGKGVIHRLDITSRSYSTISSREGVPLTSPIGLAEDNLGRLYITDSINGILYRFSPKDDSLVPLLSQGLERPTGIAFNPVNRLLYLSDTLANQILMLDQNGFIVKRISGVTTEGEGFNRPTDLAIDAVGQIYVTDSLNFRITLLTPEGQIVRQFGSPGDTGGSFSRPKGIAIDSTGNIYVSDSLMDAIQVFNQKSELQLVFGRNGVEPGQFWMPSGLYIDKLDQIYVADTYNRRIQVFRYLAHRGEEEEKNEANLFDKPLAP
jgi:DNA-binding beta-propeller fold protein YncE